MRLTLLLILSLTITNIFSQELYCNVQVYNSTTSNSSGIEERVYSTLQTAVYEFMNNRKWSNYSFKIDEKIECSILINVSEHPSLDEFTGTIQVQARRPIYKTSYNSVLLNLIDKDFKFSYQEYQPLDFTEASFTSNLTSVLAYYAYIILGMDFDSYSLYGGTPFFDKAQTIVNNAQSSGYAGWEYMANKNNRYCLIENIINPIFKPVRECIYKYHRLGLDNMYDNKAQARPAITSGMELLTKSQREKPGSYLIQTFMFAKADEIVNMYSQASQVEKTKIITILNEVDPANSQKYKEIQKN